MLLKMCARTSQGMCCRARRVSGRTVGDNYGDVTIAAKMAVISKFPHYDLREELPQAL